MTTQPVCFRCGSLDHLTPQCPWADASAKSLKVMRLFKAYEGVMKRLSTMEEPPKREPKIWELPETDDDLHEFCSQLSPSTRTRLYRHLHSLGERINS